MENFQFDSIAIPNYFFENGLIFKPVYGKFITKYFFESHLTAHVKMIGHRELTLEAYEFIFNRIKFCKEFDFTERQVRTVVDNFKKLGILINTEKGITNHYTIFLWNISKFNQE